MNKPKPFIRSSGRDTNVVCLHSSLGSSKQWSGLMDKLDQKYRVTATDLYGYGKSPAWMSDAPFSLDDEVDMLTPVLDALSGPIHLVGHSYGAAIALKTAQKQRHDIRSLVIYEPVLFALLLDNAPAGKGTAEVLQLVDDMQYAHNAGNSEQATRRFINYWSGEGAWETFSGSQQTAMAAKIGMVLANFGAAMSESGSVSNFASINIPTLYLCGGKAPSSTTEIARLLCDVLPDVTLQSFAGIGHMGPVTHSGLVNDYIESFICEADESRLRTSFAQAA